VTKRHHRYLVGLLSPKRLPTITAYRGGLDNECLEILPRYHREAAADDPWLAPEKSEAVRALLILIAGAQPHSLIDEPLELAWDLRGFCEDAELSPGETDVLVLAGDGWNQSQIASWLEVNQATVSRRLSTGRAKLAGWLPLEVASRLVVA